MAQIIPCAPRAVFTGIPYMGGFLWEDTYMGFLEGPFNIKGF